MMGTMFWTTLLSLVALSHAQGSCRYQYIEQPPQDLLCNPYPNQRLILRCTISYSTTELPVTIYWKYYSNSLATSVDISQSETKYTLFPSTFTGRVSGRLQVNSLTDADVGSYACQGVFTNGSRTEESQRLNLFSSVVFTSRRSSTCTSTAGESTTTQKCALTGQVTITGGGTNNGGGGGDNSGGGDSGTNGGTGGGGGGGSILGALGPNAPVIIAAIAIVIFLVVTACILISCCVIFQACKYFD